MEFNASAFGFGFGVNTANAAELAKIENDAEIEQAKILASNQTEEVSNESDYTTYYIIGGVVVFILLIFLIIKL